MMLIAALMTLDVQCFPSKEVYAVLDERFGESRSYIGLNEGGAIVELWSDDDGSFTVLTTFAADMSCIVAGGDDGRQIEPKPNL